ncbi:C-GCAxxG-C-C family protein [Desulfitobacterium metallireducens]|uniref:C_GCAxxG_C_C family protein n=1 Tax=Desulfitobacterium metallireducens DSM 15288 TaxID=871968 RepID=W0E572_9FIRM|nr:C-GCAxxG-C-C family protein [Desulfitobacterium metallireducens]AHF06025.1 hypothetical protein DESME_02320 [Desulfitobacterium metallireducens DSM 15288]
MSKVQEAVVCFNESFSCSQAVFSTYATQFGLDKETAFRVSASFGGGMARMGDTCGAVTGAFMVIGLKYGKTRAEDEDSKERTFQVVQEFVSRFRECNGSIICRDLLGCDISTKDGAKKAKEHNLFNTICPNLVKNSAQLLEEILNL